MLILTAKESTQQGKPRRIGKEYIDYRYNHHFPIIFDEDEIYHFVLDQKVRHMSLLKTDLEQLRVFPVLTLDDRREYDDEEGNVEDLTEKYLKVFFKALEAYMGKLEYTTEDTPVTSGVKKYLKSYGVDV